MNFLSDFINYLKYELNRSELTAIAYYNDIYQFSSWLSNENPEEIDYLSVTSNDIRTWLAMRSKAGDTPRTLRRKIISFRSFYKWLMKTGKIKRSPMDEIVLPKISKPLPEIIKPGEVEEAISEIQKDEKGEPYHNLLNALIVDMLYSLGLRRAELVGINDSDISFTKSEIKVTGKRNKQRVVPVPDPLLDKIRQWQEERNKREGGKTGDSALFLIKGKRMKVEQVYYLVRKSLKGTTARKRSPHALRHTFASGMLNGGAEIDSVREFLGHSSLSTTQIYTHISLKEIKKAYTTAHPRSHKK